MGTRPDLVRVAEEAVEVVDVDVMVAAADMEEADHTEVVAADVKVAADMAVVVMEVAVDMVAAVEVGEEDMAAVDIKLPPSTHFTLKLVPYRIYIHLVFTLKTRAVPA